MKREQSRAGSRFAECEKSRLKAKILITLALLLTAVTGAWADEPNVYNSGTVDLRTLKMGDILMSGVTLVHEIESWDGLRLEQNRYAKDGITQTSAPQDVDAPTIGENGQIEYQSITYTPVTEGGEAGGAWVVLSIVDASYSGHNYKKVSVGGIEAPLTVTWDATTKTGTFTQPGSDVVLTPQYAPAAQLDENGAPAAVSGLEIAADAAIITAGQSAQGTLLYAVGTSETEKPALTAFAATLPNAKDQTAAGNYYVWYYIQGQDTPQGQEPTAENTFNDSEIMGPVTVELLTNEHTLNIKQSPNITVTVAGTAVTPTDDKVTPVTTGQEVKIKAKDGYKFRKVEVKKAGPAADIVWDGTNVSDLHVEGNYLSYTKEGIKLSGNAEQVQAEWNNSAYLGTPGMEFITMESGGFTFTAPTGKAFTKIEMKAVGDGGWATENLGTGWAYNTGTVTWTGSAASTVKLLKDADMFSGDFISSIAFYLSE